MQTQEKDTEQILQEENCEVCTSEIEDATMQMQKQLEESLLKQEEYLNMAQRVQADFENYKKRNVNIRKDAIESGRVEVIKALLPIIDNFERALQVEDENNSFFNGVKMIYSQLLEMLQKQNVEVINRLNEIFDPNLEEVVTQGNPEDGEPGTVCEVLQKGYKLENYVLRHSMVKVVPQ
ncbi:MAG: nucleotide exchange factor GrpE [Eubacteriales bacterium]|nr:nucleotide exchange factor GrpE [Eubacteriales bacterium]